MNAEAARALVNIALQVLATRVPPGSLELEHRRREAARALDLVPFPVAVFAQPYRSPRLCNRAWRTTLPVAPPAVVEHCADVEQSNTALHIEEAIETGGRRAYYRVDLEPNRGCLGAPDGVVVMCTDITEQVIARRLGVDANTLVATGPAGQPADHLGEAWLRELGPAADWRAVVHPDDRVRCQDALAQAVRQRASSEIEARLQRVRGEFRWYRMQFFVDPSDGRWSTTAVDVHEARTIAVERAELLSSARAARADADLANRLKDEFLATVSHELRAPVTTMLLWEKLLREQQDPAIREQALDAIRKSAQAQSRLVGDLLDVARAASGKLAVDRRTIAMGPVITAAVEAALPVATAKGVTLEQPTIRSAVVEGDASRLRQVLDNLLANAIQFTESGGRVSVAMRREADSVVIEISDTGHGIPAEFLERIFQPFQQREDVMTRRHGGLGLGLTIARQLVELHGGTIRAASPGQDAGTVMTVKLPLSSQRLRAEPAPPDLRTAKPLAGKRVLVIDDDVRVREALVLLLERTGAQVDAAASAATGRNYLARTPDVVLCDLAMPEEDGYSFVKALRATGNHVPAIAITAHAQESDAKRALDAGFDVHLAKPMSFERLVATIGALVL